MKNVLFVDDERSILDGLKRLLRGQQEWQMAFVDNPVVALRMIETQPYDVVISDMRMPQVSGAEVLRHAKQHSPKSVRIALSGYAEAGLVLESAGTVHRFLAKPCDSQALVACVEQVAQLQQRLGSPALRKIIAGISSLPSLPETYRRVMRVVSDPDGTAEEIAVIVAGDMAITVKLLQIVNSGYFGLRATIESAAQAVAMLGFTTVSRLVLAIDVFRAFESSVSAHEARSIWARSLAMSATAQVVAKQLRMDKRALEQAMLAGMLADVGVLLMLSELPDQYAEVQREVAAGRARVEAETRVFGCSHMEIGAYLLTLWGLPKQIVEAVGYHHQPGASGDHSIAALTSVHVATAWLDAADTGVAALSLLDVPYLEALGLGAAIEPMLAALQAHARAEAA